MHQSEAATRLLARVRAWALQNGDADVEAVWLRQRGTLRSSPDRRPIPFAARQWIHAKTAAFRWEARARLAPGLAARVVDAFEEGRGELRVRLWGFVPLARSRGPATDLGEAQRYLAELPWCPAAYAANAELAYEARPSVAGDVLRVRLPRLGKDAWVDLHVDEAGRILEARSDTRPRGEGADAVPTPWGGRFEAWRQVGAWRVPTRVEVWWDLEAGRFVYFRAEVEDVVVSRYP